jgi:hypothetical protein
MKMVAKQWIGWLTKEREAKQERWCTDKKEKKIFLIYKEIHMGAVEKSYMRKGFLLQYMRKCANTVFNHI